MAIAYQSTGADVVTDTSDTSLDVPKPTGLTVGDFMLGIGCCVDTRSITPPAGWTQVANDTDGTGRIFVWKKVADSGDTGATTFPFAASATFNVGIVAVHRITGASSTATITTGFSTGSNSQTQQAPTIATPSNDCLVFWGAYAGTTSSTASSTADKGTEDVDLVNATGNAWMASYHQVIATANPSLAGAVITSTHFGAKRVFSIAVQDSGASGGGGVPIYMQRDLLNGYMQCLNGGFQ